MHNWPWKMDEGHASVDSKRECRTRMRHCAQLIPPPSKSILVMHQIVFKLLEMTLTFSRGHVNYRVPEGKKTNEVSCYHDYTSYLFVREELFTEIWPWPLNRHPHLSIIRFSVTGAMYAACWVYLDYDILAPRCQKQENVCTRGYKNNV